MLQEFKWPSQELESRLLFSWPRVHRSWGIMNKVGCIKEGNGLKVHSYNNMMTISIRCFKCEMLFVTVLGLL